MKMINPAIHLLFGGGRIGAATFHGLAKYISAARMEQGVLTVHIDDSESSESQPGPAGQFTSHQVNNVSNLLIALLQEILSQKQSAGMKAMAKCFLSSHGCIRESSCLSAVTGRPTSLNSLHSLFHFAVLLHCEHFRKPYGLKYNVSRSVFSPVEMPDFYHRRCADSLSRRFGLYFFRNL